MDLTDAISLRLEYFQELEHATRMLNHPGESLVLQTDFLFMVERVDVCIEFLQSHVSPLGIYPRIRNLIYIPSVNSAKPKYTSSDSNSA